MLVLGLLQLSRRQVKWQQGRVEAYAHVASCMMQLSACFVSLDLLIVRVCF